MATASVGLSVASAVLAADIASCVVLVGCAGIPTASAAVAAYTAAEVASGAAIAAYGAAIAADVVAIGLVAAAGVEAGVAYFTTPSVDFSSAIAQAQTTVDQATTAKADAQSALDQANARAASLAATVGSDRTALYQRADQVIDNLNSHGTTGKDSYNCTYMAHGSLNGSLDTLYNAALSLSQSEQSAELARAALEQATRLTSTPPSSDADSNAQSIAQLQAQLDATTDPAQRAALQQAIDSLKAQPSSGSNGAQVSQVSAQINATNDQITALNAQIDQTTDPVQKAKLQEQVLILQKQLDSLRAQMSTLSPDVAAAQLTYDNARAGAVQPVGLCVGGQRRVRHLLEPAVPHLQQHRQARPLLHRLLGLWHGPAGPGHAVWHPWQRQSDGLLLWLGRAGQQLGRHWRRLLCLAARAGQPEAGPGRL
jgi:hypothetical protein